MVTLKQILQNNGATLDIDGNAVIANKGYQVSFEDLEILPLHKLRKKHIKAMLCNVPIGGCLGIWIDGGKAYIDLSKSIRTKQEAIKFGKLNRQISIWDWKKSEAVYL